MNRRHLAAILGGAFLGGYLLAALLFFPGWGRRAIVTVPDLRGRSVAQARRIADRAGLQLERGATVAHPAVARGAVIAQHPLPGQETARGDQVRVLLSAGRPRRAVPPVLGLLGEQARNLLLRSGFQVGIDTVEDERPAGRIVSVQPASGTVLQLPAAVQLHLSSGPPPPPPVPVDSTSPRASAPLVGVPVDTVSAMDTLAPADTTP